MKTIVGLYTQFEHANQAVKAFEEAGFDRQGMSILAREKVIKENAAEEEVTAREVGKSAGAGILGGGVVGGLLGLLVGVGSVTIPGVGPAFAAGSLATALGSAAAGAGAGIATGGIIGALLQLSIPEDEANVYAEGVKRGGVLLVVQVDENREEEARRIMQSTDPLDEEELRAAWQEEGWEEFEAGEASEDKYVLD